MKTTTVLMGKNYSATNDDNTNDDKTNDDDTNNDYGEESKSFLFDQIRFLTEWLQSLK